MVERNERCCPLSLSLFSQRALYPSYRSLLPPSTIIKQSEEVAKDETPFVQLLRWRRRHGRPGRRPPSQLSSGNIVHPANKVLAYIRGRPYMTSANFLDFWTPIPSCQVYNSRNHVPFICFLGTPSPTHCEVIYGNPLRRRSFSDIR